MREETKRKLDDEQKSEITALRIVLLVGCAVGALIAAYEIASRTTVAERPVIGTTQRAVWRIAAATGLSYPELQAKLEDGRLVRVSTTVSNLPAAETKILLTEQTRATGYHSYIWYGQTAATEKP